MTVPIPGDLSYCNEKDPEGKGIRKELGRQWKSQIKVSVEE